MDAEKFNFSILFSIDLQRKVKGLGLYDERYYWGPHLPTLPQQYIKETDLRAQNLYFRPTPCRLRIDSIVYDVKRARDKASGWPPPLHRWVTCPCSCLEGLLLGTNAASCACSRQHLCSSKETIIDEAVHLGPTPVPSILVLNPLPPISKSQETSCQVEESLSRNVVYFAVSTGKGAL